MQALAKLFMTLGTMLLLVGLLLRFAPGKLGWLGHLPGDIRIGDSIYVPITSCIVVSAVLTLVLNVLARIFWR